MAPRPSGPPPLPSPSTARRPGVLLLAVLLLGGCSTVYYAAMSQLGWAKADLLGHRIQLARDTLDQTRIQLADLLPDFADARNRPDPEPGAEYTALSARLNELRANAALIPTRRSAVEQAGDALFTEWQQEIASATDPALRDRRQQEYAKLRAPYDRLLDAMRAAEASVAPMLPAMQAALTALQPGATASASPGIDPVAGDRAVRNLQLAVALADQYVAELENAA